MSDLRWEVRGDTARCAKRMRDETSNVAHKRRKTEEPPVFEVPSDLQDMEIPLEDMGDVTVLTGL